MKQVSMKERVNRGGRGQLMQERYREKKMIRQNIYKRRMTYAHQ